MSKKATRRYKELKAQLMATLMSGFALRNNDPARYLSAIKDADDMATSILKRCNVYRPVGGIDRTPSELWSEDK